MIFKIITLSALVVLIQLTNTTTAGPCSTYSIYKNGEACEGNGAGRDINSDGNLNACIESNIKKGNRFVVWTSGKLCFGSKTCDNPYGADYLISYDITSCATTTTRPPTTTTTSILTTAATRPTRTLSSATTTSRPPIATTTSTLTTAATRPTTTSSSVPCSTHSDCDMESVCHNGFCQNCPSNMFRCGFGDGCCVCNDESDERDCGHGNSRSKRSPGMTNEDTEVDAEILMQDKAYTCSMKDGNLLEKKPNYTVEKCEDLCVFDDDDDCWFFWFSETYFCMTFKDCDQFDVSKRPNIGTTYKL